MGGGSSHRHGWDTRTYLVQIPCRLDVLTRRTAAIMAAVQQDLAMPGHGTPASSENDQWIAMSPQGRVIAANDHLY